ncbi:efflux RND transporter permease subunit [Halobacteriovorax sp. JY17]|uniref:efflux RND transporter permease subunit n=1 Tax=Halobacteriovorax sp. JY17 TaxID=2014617 RepID=UPI000C4EDCE4|nr:efflux RND transporter permease subunit [Halobacteriovorax sp. JY17]PIK13640.1 MAG: hypothetical protein CES88_15735 [Halobacteriovorax sp. JY17]
MRKVLRYLLDNPLITKFTFILILLGAMLGARNLQRTSYPQVDLQKLVITTFYPEASPRDVEVNVTNNLEYELKKVEGIKYFSSRSMEGQSTITVVLDQDFGDFQGVKDNIQRALDKVNNLPARVIQRPNVLEMKVDSFPIYDVALISDSLSEEEILSLTKKLRRRILQIPEIYKADISGKREREFQVIVDPIKLSKFDLSFDDVMISIKSNQISASGGTIESYVNERKIITLSELDTPKKLESIIIRSNYSGKSVLVRDVAKVVYGFSKKNIITSYNGEEGLGLWLYKVPRADIIRTIDEVKRVVEDFKRTHGLKNIKFVNTHDLSSETRNRLSMVYSNIILGLALILLILLFFFNIKVALWVSFGIPFSLAFLMIMMPILGLTLNSISLCGVIVVLGMIVDDAIIVSQSIYSRKNNTDDSLVDSVLQVVRPISITILTSIISFIPIFFIPGLLGQFTAEIPAVVIIVLIGSFIESIIFLPIHLRGTNLSAESSSIGKKTMRLLENNYGLFLNFLIRNKFKSLVAIVLLLISFLGIGLHGFKFQMFPEFQAQRIYLFGEVNRGKTIAHTASVAKSVDKLVKTIGGNDVVSYRTRVGRNYEGQYHCEQCFYIKVELTGFNERERSAVDIEGELLSKIQGMKGLKSFGSKIDSGAPPSGNDLEVILLAQDLKTRQMAVENLSNELEAISKGSLSNDILFGAPSFVLRPIYEKLSRLGTDVSQVAKSLRVAFSGEIIGFLNKGDERSYIKVISKHREDGFIGPIDGISVLNNKGRKLPLKKLVKLSEEKLPIVVTHYNGEESNSILINKVREGVSASQINSIINRFSSENKNVDLIVKGKMFKSKERLFNLFLGIGITCLLIYFALVILYKSYFLPLLICSSVPIGLIGILFFFKIHGAPLSALGLVGIIGFIGVVINDALLMIEVMKEVKINEGASSIIQGAQKRFAPIFLTTITTLFGVIPSIYGLLGGTDAFISPMVLAMGSGLLFGTISDLVIIPLVFSFIYKVRDV